MRYNLIDNNLCNKYWAFFFSVIFPWLIGTYIHTCKQSLYIYIYTYISPTYYENVD